MKHLRNATALLAALCLNVSAGTLPASASSAAPLGFQLMCLATPQHCQSGGASSVIMTDRLLNTIDQVNRQVNRSITPRGETYGNDIWEIGARVGDCEEYALTKRMALISSGLPPSALRIAHVRTQSGADHAVLIVKSDLHDLVLDNLRSEVLPLSMTAYRLVSMSGPNPTVWTR